MCLWTTKRINLKYINSFCFILGLVNLNNSVLLQSTYLLNCMHHSYIKSLIRFVNLKHPHKMFIFLVTHTELHTCPCVVTTITCKKWLCDMACLRHFLYDCYILDVYHRFEEKNVMYRSQAINVLHWIHCISTF